MWGESRSAFSVGLICPIPETAPFWVLYLMLCESSSIPSTPLEWFFSQTHLISSEACAHECSVDELREALCESPHLCLCSSLHCGTSPRELQWPHSPQAAGSVSLTWGDSYRIQTYFRHFSKVARQSFLLKPNCISIFITCIERVPPVCWALWSSLL